MVFWLELIALHTNCFELVFDFVYGHFPPGGCLKCQSIFFLSFRFVLIKKLNSHFPSTSWIFIARKMKRNASNAIESHVNHSFKFCDWKLMSWELSSLKRDSNWIDEEKVESIRFHRMQRRTQLWPRQNGNRIEFSFDFFLFRSRQNVISCRMFNEMEIEIRSCWCGASHHGRKDVFCKSAQAFNRL